LNRKKCPLLMKHNYVAIPNFRDFGLFDPYTPQTPTNMGLNPVVHVDVGVGRAKTGVT